MLRALLWGALSVSAVTACGSKDDAQKTAPGGVAGKVIEAKGTVKVGAKALAKDDTITADDVIETGADSSVTILLAHNNARWTLGPNRKVKATDSAAWTAEKGAGGSTDQDTAAAGRPAEKSAADTSTSSRGVIGAADEKKEAAPAAAAAAPAPAQTGSPGAAPPPPPAAQPPPPPKVERAEAPRAAIAPIGGGGDGAAAKGSRADAPPPPPPPPPAPAETKPADAVASTGMLDTSTLSTCLAKGVKVKLSLHVKAHVPTIKFLTAADAKTKSCITSAAKVLAKHVESADMTLELTSTK